MKSIKEKSQDYVSGFHPSVQRMCKESFGDGANYVLDEVECILEDKDLDCEERCNELIALVEQLKK